MRSARTISIISLAVLCGCTTWRADPVLDVGGPTALTERQRPEVLTENNPFTRFRTLYLAAMQSNAAADSRKLLDSGMALISNNCSDFFAARGNTQSILALVRDSTSTLFPIATGAISVAGAASSAVPILSLVEAGTAGGINVVARNFLFGADNIDDVRTLTLNALSSHATGVRKAMATVSDTELTFDWVSQQLIDHQAICLPPRILALSKEAIALVNIKSYETATPAKEVEKELLQKQEKIGKTGAAGAVAARAELAGLKALPKLPSRIGVRVDNR